MSTPSRRSYCVSVSDSNRYSCCRLRTKPFLRYGPCAIPTSWRTSIGSSKGGPKGPPLLGAPLNALRDHGELPHSAASDDVQRFLVRTSERRCLRAERCRNGAEVFALRAEHLHARHARPHVQPPLVVDAHAIGVTAFEHRELAEVAQRAIGLHVERIDRRSV